MASPSQPKPPLDPGHEPDARGYPDNPVVVRVRRGAEVESQHRGAWVVCDASGAVIDGHGEWSRPVFVRSSIKCLQALPLIESGAAARYRFADDEIALALASHNAETCHTERVARVLARLGLSVSDLHCGPQPPGDPDARAVLRERGEAPSALHNNCSGKHAGFLALALHLGVSPERYLDPESAGQRLVAETVLDLCGLDPSEITTAIDGCSAPTFRMPLTALATAFARVSTPDSLDATRRAACERMTTAVAAYPELIAGRHRRICTDLVRASSGRLFPKVGGEAVYAVGLRGSGRALALKIDDGSARGLHALLLELLPRFGFLDAEAARSLESYAERSQVNWAGLEVGRTEVVG